MKGDGGVLEEVTLGSKYGVKGLREFKVPTKPLRPRVGLICVKEEPSWSLLGNDLCNCVWMLGRNDTIHSFKKEVPIMTLNEVSLCALVK